MVDNMKAIGNYTKLQSKRLTSISNINRNSNFSSNSFQNIRLTTFEVETAVEIALTIGRI